jgi:hypothetical protein
MAIGSFEVEPGVFMAASCHHRRGPNASACGPCYARLIVALERVEQAGSWHEARSIVEETHRAMRADAPVRKTTSTVAPGTACHACAGFVDHPLSSERCIRKPGCVGVPGKGVR